MIAVRRPAPRRARARPRRLLARDGGDGRSQQLLGRRRAGLDVDRGDEPGPLIGTARRRHPGVDGAHPRAADRGLVKPVRSASFAAADPSTPITITARTYQRRCRGGRRRMARPVIDLRSDTVTRPTPGMRAAIAAAVVGDEQMREDPTVNELQERVADAARPGAGALPADGDDGESDRAEAPRPPRRRPGRRAALAHPHLRVRRRRRSRRAPHGRAAGRGRAPDGGAGARRDLDRRGRRRPAPRRARAREHPQRRGRARLAARRARRRRRRRARRPVSACTWTGRGS